MAGKTPAIRLGTRGHDRTGLEFDVIESKRCSRCKATKPVGEFGRRAAAPDGLHPYCKACVREYCKARYVKHAEQIQAANREYRVRNADVVKQRDRVNYAANRDRYRAANARYYAQHSEARAAAARERRLTRDIDVERAYRRAYRSANKDRRREQEHRKRARDQGSQVLPLTRAMVVGKIDYWGRKCWICSGPFEAIDHVKPISKGGAHILANIRPVCMSCNSKKHNTWPYNLAVV